MSVVALRSIHITTSVQYRHEGGTNNVHGAASSAKRYPRYLDPFFAELSTTKYLTGPLQEGISADYLL